MISFFNAVHALQVDAGLTTKPETTAVIQSANVNTTVQEQSIIVGDKIISVRIEGKKIEEVNEPFIRGSLDQGFGYWFCDCGR